MVFSSLIILIKLFKWVKISHYTKYVYDGGCILKKIMMFVYASMM